LEVRSIHFGSPGVKDFAGLGEIVGHVKDMIFHLLELNHLRRKRDLENREREIRNRKLELENELLEMELESGRRLSNVTRFLMLAEEEIGASKEEVRQFGLEAELRQRTFMRLVAEGKIKGAELLDEMKK
jgi:hypothetical protein